MGRAQRLRARTQSELNSLHNKTNKAVEEEEWRWQLQELIQNKDVDVIRKLAFKGFINRRFRKEIWPLLLNVKPSDRYNWDSRRHKKYGDIIDKDVNRSFNRIEVATTVPERIQCSLRNQLRDLLNGVLNKDEELHYVQGLHDIFSVILFECGEKLAYPIALELCRGKIKEFTRDSLQVTIMALDLLFPLVRKLDEKVEKFLVNSSVRPFFALSWFITWFSHDILNNQVVLHFFDFFLASHPLMPLYMCAIIVSRSKDGLLLRECEFSEVHSFFSTLPEPKNAALLCKDSTELFERYPPKLLIRETRTEFPPCCLFLEDSEDFDQHTLKISLPLFNAFNVKLKKLLLGIFLSVAIAILYLFAFRVKVD